MCSFFPFGDIVIKLLFLNQLSIAIDFFLLKHTFRNRDTLSMHRYLSIIAQQTLLGIVLIPAKGNTRFFKRNTTQILGSDLNGNKSSLLVILQGRVLYSQSRNYLFCIKWHISLLAPDYPVTKHTVTMEGRFKLNVDKRRQNVSCVIKVTQIHQRKTINMKLLLASLGVIKEHANPVKILLFATNFNFPVT